MDVTVISTYRCNSRCSMCHIWKYPTLPIEEIGLDSLDKLPDNIDNCNISGGEPTLRKDLSDMVDILYSKSRIIEISTNGLHSERLIPIVKKYPDIKIRLSLEGTEATNNIIRGEKNGFEKKLKGMKELKKAGGKDLGFAFVVQDENASELMFVYELTQNMGLELSTSTLHNAWQFHKNDNYHYNRVNSAKSIENLITGMLDTWSVKNWFRAYMNLGLIEKTLGHKRLHPCVAGKGFIFIDPWSDVWACNVRTDLSLGNIKESSWEEIIDSDLARLSIEKVKVCEQNCWMVTTARTAMRSTIHPSLPKYSAARWVLTNKIKRIFKSNINFDNYIDYSNILPNVITSNSQIQKDGDEIVRKSFMNEKSTKKIQTKKDPHYTQGEYYNL